MCRAGSTAQWRLLLFDVIAVDDGALAIVADPPGDVATRLADALAESGLSQTELARRLAGPDADRRRVDARRRLVLKWLQRRHFPSATSAHELAEIFNRAPEFFSVDRATQTRQRGLLAAADLDLLGYVQESAAGSVEAGECELRLPIEGDALAAMIPLFNPARILVDRVVELDA